MISKFCALIPYQFVFDQIMIGFPIRECRPDNGLLGDYEQTQNDIPQEGNCRS